MKAKPIVFKSKHMLSLAFTMISGCTTVWDEQGFSRPEQQEWKQLGYGDDDSYRANEWRKIGAKAQDAHNWEDAGFKLDIATEWKKNGFDLKDAHSWWKRDFKIQDALSLKANGLDLDTAFEWKNSGFSAAESFEFMKRGLTPQQAVEFRQLDFTVAETKDWLNTKFFPSNLRSHQDFLERIRLAKSLSKMNVSPATVSSWQADGATIDSITRNAKWLALSLTFPQFKTWSEAGFDSETAHQAIQKGLTIHQAKAHFAEKQKIEARIESLERLIRENGVELTRMKEDQTCIQVSFNVISKLTKGRYEVELLTAGYAQFAPGSRYLLSTQITQFTSRGRSASFVKWGSPVTADTVDGFKKTVRTLSEVPKCVNAANKIMEANEKLLWERQALQCLSDSNNVSEVPQCVNSAKKRVENLFGSSRP
jgi:hypothetical protein